MNWYTKVLKQYTRFHGRARRSEFWYFNLINFLINLSILLFSALLPQELGGLVLLLFYIYNFGVFLPSLAVTIRRLHDTGKSGWWCLINFIPFGSLVLLFFMLQDSESGPNQYGRNPKE
ncbi:MAG: DUF805 domain-containing protein [Cyanobacteria bacterium P01_C01_bin.72]